MRNLVIRAFSTLTCVAFLHGDAHAVRSSFTVSGVQVDGDELVIDIVYRHYGQATPVNFYVGRKRPEHNEAGMKKGVAVTPFTMRSGSGQRSLRVKLADITGKLKLRPRQRLHVSSHWPIVYHYWGTILSYAHDGTSITLPASLRSSKSSTPAAPPHNARWARRPLLQWLTAHGWQSPAINVRAIGPTSSGQYSRFAVQLATPAGRRRFTATVRHVNGGVYGTPPRPGRR